MASRLVCLTLLFNLSILSSGQDVDNCVDRTDNTIRIVNSIGGQYLPVQVGDLLATTYDANRFTTCNDTGGDITFPGAVEFIAGSLTVFKQIDINSIKVLVTLKKNDSSVGWLCLDGVKQNDQATDELCSFDLCSSSGSILSFGLCGQLSAPGTYYYFQKNEIYFFLNPIPYEDRNLMTGMFKLSLQAKIGDEIIFAWTFAGTKANDGWVHITKTGVQ